MFIDMNAWKLEKVACLAGCVYYYYGIKSSSPSRAMDVLVWKNTQLSQQPEIRITIFEPEWVSTFALFTIQLGSCDSTVPKLPGLHSFGKIEKAGIHPNAPCKIFHRNAMWLQVRSGTSTLCQKTSSWRIQVYGHQHTGDNNDPCLKLVFSFLRTGPNWINYVQFFFPNITLLKEVIHKIGDNVYVYIMTYYHKLWSLWSFHLIKIKLPQLLNVSNRLVPWNGKFFSIWWWQWWPSSK